MDQWFRQFDDALAKSLGVSPGAVDKMLWSAVIGVAYPTQRFYDNAAEGKPGARATPPIHQNEGS